MKGHPVRQPARKGFTLIELLIVVAIIAILAAIAVPNFLEAQVRSKVSRVLGELRSFRTAIEAYAVDYSRYPRHGWGDPITGYGNTPNGDRYNGQRLYQTFLPVITTPVAYISKFDNFDPLVDSKRGTVSEDARLYTYSNMKSHEFMNNNAVAPGSNRRATPESPDDIEVNRQDMGEFYMLSVGPKGNDRLYWPVLPGQAGFFTQYDPTNGTLSEGTIYVSQKHSSPVQRPFP